MGARAPTTPSQAAKDPRPALPQSPNQARQVWINETALTTALNTSFFASFGRCCSSIVMGAALLLTGIGFLVLATGLVGRTVTRRREASVAPSAGLGDAT